MEVEDILAFECRHAFRSRRLTVGVPAIEPSIEPPVGERSGLDEVRELAAVLLQSERYGTASVKALRLHSETCRQQRHQRAEERAQKAAVKILFPTLLCIFPAIFIVILGPAAYQIVAMLSKMR